MDRDSFVCELTKETYKTLRKEYAIETQLTLKKEDISGGEPSNDFIKKR